MFSCRVTLSAVPNKVSTISAAFYKIFISVDIFEIFMFESELLYTMGFELQVKVHKAVGLDKVETEWKKYSIYKISYN